MTKNLHCTTSTTTHGGGHTVGNPCVFPFLLHHRLWNTCTGYDKEFLWCFTSEAGRRGEGPWAECTSCTPSEGTYQLFLNQRYWRWWKETFRSIIAVNFCQNVTTSWNRASRVGEWGFQTLENYLQGLQSQLISLILGFEWYPLQCALCK